MNFQSPSSLSSDISFSPIVVVVVESWANLEPSEMMEWGGLKELAVLGWLNEPTNQPTNQFQWMNEWMNE